MMFHAAAAPETELRHRPPYWMEQNEQASLRANLMQPRPISTGTPAVTARPVKRSKTGGDTFGEVLPIQPGVMKNVIDHSVVDLCVHRLGLLPLSVRCCAVEIGESRVTATVHVTAETERCNEVDKGVDDLIPDECVVYDAELGRHAFMSQSCDVIVADHRDNLVVDPLGRSTQLHARLVGGSQCADAYGEDVVGVVFDVPEDVWPG
jgi:hypothetical protein